EHDVLSARHRWTATAHLQHRLEGFTANQERVKLLQVFRKIEVRIHDNPVIFAARSRDVAVEAHGAAESYKSHTLSPSCATQRSRCIFCSSRRLQIALQTLHKSFTKQPVAGELLNR